MAISDSDPFASLIDAGCDSLIFAQAGDGAASGAGVASGPTRPESRDCAPCVDLCDQFDLILADSAGCGLAGKGDLG